MQPNVSRLLPPGRHQKQQTRPPAAHPPPARVSARRSHRHNYVATQATYPSTSPIATHHPWPARVPLPTPVAQPPDTRSDPGDTLAARQAWELLGSDRGEWSRPGPGKPGKQPGCRSVGCCCSPPRQARVCAGPASCREGQRHPSRQPNLPTGPAAYLLQYYSAGTEYTRRVPRYDTFLTQPPSPYSVGACRACPCLAVRVLRGWEPSVWNAAAGRQVDCARDSRHPAARTSRAVRSGALTTPTTRAPWEAWTRPELASGFPWSARPAPRRPGSRPPSAHLGTRRGADLILQQNARGTRRATIPTRYCTVPRPTRSPPQPSGPADIPFPSTLCVSTSPSH